MFRVYVCNTKQILITFAERRSEQSRTTERDTHRERERYVRAHESETFFSWIRKKLQTHKRAHRRSDFKKRTHPRIFYLAFGFFSRIIVAFAAKNTHK